MNKLKELIFQKKEPEFDDIKYFLLLYWIILGFLILTRKFWRI